MKLITCVDRHVRKEHVTFLVQKCRVRMYVSQAVIVMGAMSGIKESAFYQMIVQAMVSLNVLND